jgi:hypothetical protein
MGEGIERERGLDKEEEEEEEEEEASKIWQLLSNGSRRTHSM